MKDYSQLSDFEINKLVAESLFPDGEIVGEHDRMIDNTYPHAAQIIHEAGISGEVHDYCNNPSDIMPLMIEHRMSLVHQSLNGSYSCVWNQQGGLWDINDISSNDRSPYRAIAICFLKMQEAKA